MVFKKNQHYTQARIGLGHAGASMPTNAWLSFAYHHAVAVDAIKRPWKPRFAKNELLSLGLPAKVLHTRITNRKEYLLRPDLGSLLDDRSRKLLKAMGNALNDGIVIIASNGLSSLAAEKHLGALLATLAYDLLPFGFSITDKPIMLAKNGRVALIDEIGEILKPKIGLVIIGERPGLSSADSLAAYLTFKPRCGLTNAERNCVSNIRPPHGLSYAEASKKIIFLINEALRQKLSGVKLKEEATSVLREFTN